MNLRIRGAAALILLCARPLFGTEPEILIDEASFRPYGICAGTLRSEEGFSGTVEVRGRLFDGREVPLFRAELTGWTSALEFRFIPDERVRTLFLAGRGYERELPLAGARADEEGRRLLRSLAVPFRSWAPGASPGSAAFRARDPGGAGLKAAVFFAHPSDPRTFWILGVYAAALLGILRFGGRLGRAFRPALLALSAAAGLGVTVFGLSGAVLFRFPLPDLRGPYEYPVVREIEGRPGYAVVSFRGGEDGKPEQGPVLTVLGIRTPSGRPLPLSAFPRGARLKFIDPPLVVLDPEGGFALSFTEFALGWGLYE